MTPLETQAVELMRQRGALIVGQRPTNTTALKHGLDMPHVLPSVVQGLEHHKQGVKFRPVKSGPAHVVRAALQGSDMELSEWKRKALIYDVFMDGKNRGQVAALNPADAVKEARDFWRPGKRIAVTVDLRGALYGERR